MTADFREAMLAYEVRLSWDMFHSVDPHRRRVAAQLLGRIEGRRDARDIARRLGWR